MAGSELYINYIKILEGKFLNLFKALGAQMMCTLVAASTS